MFPVFSCCNKAKGVHSTLFSIVYTPTAKTLGRNRYRNDVKRLNVWSSLQHTCCCPQGWMPMASKRSKQLQARTRRSDRQESIFNIRAGSIDGVAEGQGQPRREICDWRIHGTERFSPSFWCVTVGCVFGREAPLRGKSGNGI